MGAGAVIVSRYDTRCFAAPIGTAVVPSSPVVVLPTLRRLELARPSRALGVHKR